MPESQLRRVHDYTVAKGQMGAPGVAKIVSVNPIVRFVSAGTPPINWQGGKWFDDGGQPLAESSVPEEYKRRIKEKPPVLGLDNGQPDLIINCDFCPADAERGIGIPQSQYARHLADFHVTAPARPLTPSDLPTPEAYQTDAAGNVKTDVRGRPKRKIGRPKKAA
jgi:hypothetical protein